ncbi:hypothetical protein [Caproicibacter sp.]|uniref:hypothetical protein n=1 Tax=Caproicibacter sp. TaxID=2814884 RepID=UPI0039899572
MKITSCSNWLSMLPTAANQAKNITGTLRQLSDDAVSASTSSGCCQKVHFLGSLDASDNDYTAQDALEQQWYAQSKVSLDFSEAPENQPSIQITLEPSQSDLDALRTKLRTDGLDSGVDWSELDFAFSALHFDTTNNMNCFQPEELGTKLDYLTSRYAYLKTTFSSDSSEDAMEQGQKLNDLYQTTLNHLASTYADGVGGFLENNGAGGETQKFYDSILAQADRLTNQYSDYLSSHADYAGLSDSPDQWLSSDDAYMAARLRDAVQTDSGKAAANTAYSINDMELAGKYAQQLTGQFTSINNNSEAVLTENEESIGLDCASLAMKVNVFIEQSGMGGTMADTINSSFSGYLENYLNQMNEQLQAQPRLYAEDERGFSSLQKDQVLAVFRHTMSAYHESGDALQAILAGANYGGAIYAQKRESAEYDGIYRYSEKFETSYWENFSTAPNQITSYDDSSSTFQKYDANWSAFLVSLHSGDVDNIDFYLGNRGRLSVTRTIPQTVPEKLNIIA